MVEWQKIETYDPKKNIGHILCSHETKRWIRFGRMYPEMANRWYYSGTNERSQYAQVIGDEPTHWAPMPDGPWISLK
jgi:hypothetical protein